MATATKLKKLPGFSQGVRIGASVRTVKMARPICPNSVIEMERTPDGKLIPAAISPGRINCQLEGIGWQAKCEALGHEPYVTKKVWYTKKDEYGPDPDDPTSESQVLIGQKTIRHETSYPNFAQVGLGVRLNSGQGVKRAVEVKGFKFPHEIGYQDCCQYRNCQKPVDPRHRSRAFGEYCSAEHLQLIAADHQGIFLTQTSTGLEGPEAEKIKQKRSKQLREAAAFAVE